MQTYLKSKPAWLQLLLFIAIAFGSYIVITGIGGAILQAITGIPINQMGSDMVGGQADWKSVLNIRGLVVCQFIGLWLIPSLWYAKLADRRPLSYLGLRAPVSATYWLLGTAVLLVAFPLVQLTGVLNQKLPFPAALATRVRDWEASALRIQNILLADRSIGNLLINLLLIAVFAGVGEELFFRGVIQRILIRSFKSPWAGIIVAAFLFSFFHMQFFGFIPRFLLGILLGAAYWYSGSIWVAMVAHTVFDGVQLVAAWFHPELINDQQAAPFSILQMLAAAAVSAVLVGFLVWRMKQSSTESYASVFRSEEEPEFEIDQNRSHGL